MKLSLSLSLALLTLVCPLRAADELPTTLLTERGELLVSEDFATPMPAPASADPKHLGNWHFAVGKWTIGDGLLTGVELPADHHPAHAAYNIKFQDVVIQCDVRLDGCRMTRVRATDDADYVCSMRMTPQGFSLFKDDHDHDGPDKDELLASEDIPLQAGEWHSLLLEIQGNEAVATLDGKSIAGSHPLIGVKKQSLRFAVIKGSASYRRLRVWEARPNPNWDKTKPLLSSGEK